MITSSQFQFYAGAWTPGECCIKMHDQDWFTQVIPSGVASLFMSYKSNRYTIADLESVRSNSKGVSITGRRTVSIETRKNQTPFESPGAI